MTRVDCHNGIHALCLSAVRGKQHRKLAELHHPIKGTNELRLDGGRNVGIGRRLRYMFVEGDVFVLRKAHERERGEKRNTKQRVRISYIELIDVTYK